MIILLCLFASSVLASIICYVAGDIPRASFLMLLAITIGVLYIASGVGVVALRLKQLKETLEKN